MTLKRRIAIIGGGPSALFMYKRLIESGQLDLEIEIFEKKNALGSGMPYSSEGANDEHVTNVSENEIPDLVTSVSEWLSTVPADLLVRFDINLEKFNEYKVLPRLLFGYYLTAQFNLLQQIASQFNIETIVHYQSNVIDVQYDSENKAVWIYTATEKFKFDDAVICTGHSWPSKFEGKYEGCFDSPYPPAKLKIEINHHVAIKGASLTAIDAVRTLARQNGLFFTDDHGNLNYTLNEQSTNFKIIMHSLSGLLPAVRFHLEDSLLSNNALLTAAEIDKHKKENNGFISLDYLFQKDFKDIFLNKDPEFYDKIKHFSIEEFVNEMMDLRLRLDPFLLLKAEYTEAEKSIKRQESVYWKEMLAVLSFAMNHPAKYFSAEDMQRLQKVLMPLISIIIAFVPQKSCVELLALYNAGVLSLLSVSDDSKVEPQEEGIVYHYIDEDGVSHSQSYKTYVDCVGQPHLSYDDFPFEGLKKQKLISPAQLRFQSAALAKECLITGNEAIVNDSQGNYYLKVSGISINDNFQILDYYGAYNENIYIMAVPYIGGYNPDYSGLDFCEATSLRIVNNMFATKT
ncbi:FAD-NAD(P)-binding [Flavobacterium micromati]|uniref:FAD-NAD(P)-binding n=1 Tax=Flavobacterium micromati TaxID=229205 RepID=A0A1M5ISZ3_9FLAO|nr:FAD/NAD(P)-binding protein [Flavobacterium micromati]SHG31090.1 FAD-NAD(P)-binding [Flavobacterium micromati]